jgi:hypothetical protein
LGPKFNGKNGVSIMARHNIGSEKVNMWEHRQKSLNNNNNMVVKSVHILQRE